MTLNVYPVADPAFLIGAMQPEEKIYIEQGAIDGDLEPLIKITASIMAEVARRTESQVYLIPHVANLSSNDYTFMQRALSLILGENENITT